MSEGAPAWPPPVPRLGALGWTIWTRQRAGGPAKLSRSDDEPASLLAPMPIHGVRMSLVPSYGKCQMQTHSASALGRHPRTGCSSMGALGVARSVSPTLRRRELGARLRQLRMDAGKTADDVAQRLMVSSTKISRLETGARGVSLRDVRDLCDVYGVSAEEREHLMSLARQSREDSWWQRYDLPYSTYVGLESAATPISDFKSDVVHGLLQTDNYAHAVLEATVPDPSDERLAQIVESRR